MPTCEPHLTPASPLQEIPLGLEGREVVLAASVVLVVSALKPAAADEDLQRILCCATAASERCLHLRQEDRGRYARPGADEREHERKIQLERRPDHSLHLSLLHPERRNTEGLQPCLQPRRKFPPLLRPSLDYMEVVVDRDPETGSPQEVREMFFYVRSLFRLFELPVPVHASAPAFRLTTSRSWQSTTGSEVLS